MRSSHGILESLRESLADAARDLRINFQTVLEAMNYVFYRS